MPYRRFTVSVVLSYKKYFWRVTTLRGQEVERSACHVCVCVCVCQIYTKLESMQLDIMYACQWRNEKKVIQRINLST